MEDRLTVSQLNENIKLFLEESFGFVLVEGEISNLRRPQSGHTYFTLKDDKSQIRAVFFRPFGAYQKLGGFELEEGLNVLCRGRLNVYLPRGEYQLIVESVEPMGAGAMQKAFEQLKAKLSAEGLFDERHKKPLPFSPRKIAVITSPTGAVIKDILNITKRRFPSLDIVVAPVRVQGIEAAPEMIRALRNLHAYGGADVIIIARGGGSLEDLAPFNDEALAREIFNAEIPVVSAVGHETDFTICDFVSDLRAPTPSAAAELIAPQRVELISKIISSRERMISGFYRHLNDSRERMCDLQARMKDPRRFVVDLKIDVDDFKERLKGAFCHQKQNRNNALAQLMLRLLHRNPATRAAQKKTVVENLLRQLRGGITMHFTALRERLGKDAALLESLSPLSVLQRGYSIARRADTRAVIRSADEMNVGDDVNVRLASGHFNANVREIFQE